MINFFSIVIRYGLASIKSEGYQYNREVYRIKHEDKSQRNSLEVVSKEINGRLK